MSASPFHLTLTAATVATVTFDTNYGQVVILNRDGSAEVYFRTDGTAPTVGGTGCEVLPAAIGAVAAVDSGAGGVTVVKLISSGTPAVTVAGR